MLDSLYHLYLILVQRLRSEEKLNDLLERVLSREGSTEALHSATRLLSKPEAETRPKEPQSETRSEQGAQPSLETLVSSPHLHAQGVIILKYNDQSIPTCICV